MTREMLFDDASDDDIIQRALFIAATFGMKEGDTIRVPLRRRRWWSGQAAPTCKEPLYCAEVTLTHELLRPRIRRPNPAES